MDINSLLKHSEQQDASDIHISSKNPPIFRVHGDMIPLKVPALEPDQVKDIIYSIMNDKQKKIFEESMEIDFAIHLDESHRYRINAFSTLNGPAAVLRSIPTKIKTLGDLNTPKIIETLTKLHQGLILVTGPTGSGKSTTVAAMIDHVNRNLDRHIITIEDPIEFVHKSAKSLINQREIGIHSSSFARALKSALREDPDVILVGELRDLETIHSALTAAETGHLVIATLHTSSAAQTVDRIIDVFPSDDKAMIRTMLSNSLEAVISQRLLKKKDDSGRVSVYEILVATSAVRNLIREGKTPQIQSIMQVGSKFGMKTMKESVIEMVNKGFISNDTAKIALSAGETHSETHANTHANTGF